MFKKSISLIAAAIMLLAALAGCASNPATPAEASPAAPAAPSAEPVKSEAPAPAPSVAPAAPETITVVDHNGESVVIPKEINRIAVTTIYPWPAMLSMYLRSADKIVAIHSVSMAAAKNGILGKLYPKILEANTDWMKGEAINIEELLKLKPDVVFYSAPNTAEAEAFKAAGIPAIGVHATKWKWDTIKTFDEWVSLLQQVFPESVDNVKGVSDYSKKVLADIQAKVANIPDDKRKKAMFLFQYDENVMITSGKNFFGQYWIDSVGGKNVAEGVLEAGSNATISMEQVYEWDPEIIYITNFTPTMPDDLYNNKVRQDDWKPVKAVKNKQVYKLPLGAYRTYTPGVDTPLTLMWMAKTMYPELFADVDMAKEVRSYYKDFFSIDLTDEDINAMFNPSGAAGVAGFMNK